MMKVTPTGRSTRTRAHTRQVVRILKTMMEMHQRAARENTQALGLARKGADARVLTGSTGVRQ